MSVLATTTAAAPGGEGSGGTAATIMPTTALFSGAPSIVEKGERHAGNNFLQAVLRLNFPNVTDHTGCNTDDAVSAKLFCCWTHGYAADTCARMYEPPLTSMLFLVRSPYSWLVAMHHEPYEYEGNAQRLSFSEFLRSPFVYTPGNYPNAKADTQPNPVALWAAKVDAYRGVTMPHVVLTHEDLYDEAALTKKVAAHAAAVGLSYPPGQNGVQLPPLGEGGTNAKMEGVFTKSEFASARQYEASKAWLKYYSAEDLDFVNSIIGDDRLSWQGFEKISSPQLSRSSMGMGRRSASLDSSLGELNATDHRRMLDFLDDRAWHNIAPAGSK